MHRELILGGPGCGKTTKLLSLVGSHLASGVRPDQIAYVAFTRKASNEANERARRQFNLHEKELPYFRTLHSFAFKELGLSSDQLMTVDHYKELGSILKVDFGKVDDEWGTMSDQKERGSQYYHIEQQARLRQMDLRCMCLLDGRQGYPGVQRYLDSLIAYKRNKRVYDYTDILEQLLLKMQPLPIQVLIVDESQDLSPLQWSLVHKMERYAQFVYYAGDDDQAIYEWAGADINHFLGLGVKTTVLPVSHRLPRKIFERCDRISRRIKNRYRKDWQPADREGIIQTVGSPELAPVGTGTWMVLARNNHHLTNLSGFFKSKGHAFNFSGKSSLASRDALAVRAWLRAQKEEYVSFADVKSILPKFYTSRFKGDKAVIQRMDNDVLIPKEELADQYGIDLSQAWEDNLLLKFEEKQYIKMLLFRKVDLEKEPTVTISTIHAVKGGEADNVLVMPDMSAACYDSFIMRPDQEARVFYVACSRAKERLVLCHPQGKNYFPL